MNTNLMSADRIMHLRVVLIALAASVLFDIIAISAQLTPSEAPLLSHAKGQGPKAG